VDVGQADPEVVSMIEQLVYRFCKNFEVNFNQHKMASSLLNKLKADVAALVLRYPAKSVGWNKTD